MNPKPRQLFFGRFAVMAVVSLAQSTVMALGNLFFLDVQVTSPWLFMVCFWGCLLYTSHTFSVGVRAKMTARTTGTATPKTSAPFMSRGYQRLNVA